MKSVHYIVRQSKPYTENLIVRNFLDNGRAWKVDIYLWFGNSHGYAVLNLLKQKIRSQSEKSIIESEDGL